MMCRQRLALRQCLNSRRRNRQSTQKIAYLLNSRSLSLATRKYVSAFTKAKQDGQGRQRSNQGSQARAAASTQEEQPSGSTDNWVPSATNHSQPQESGSNAHVCTTSQPSQSVNAGLYSAPSVPNTSPSNSFHFRTNGSGKSIFVGPGNLEQRPPQRCYTPVKPSR